MATLLEITERLPEFKASDAIYAAEPWDPLSLAVVLDEPRDGSLPAEVRQLSCRFFLDIAVCRASMIGFRAWLGREPTLEERCRELISFASEHAEPGASPNGGPAEPLGNSGIGGGPPSVS
jgi:hypothetical protein